MPYIAKKNFTEQAQVFGNGQCVALVRELTGAPASSTWREGDKLVDLLEINVPIAPGTAIATFFDGRYPNWPHGNHAAIFLRWVSNGIEVFHQWKGKAPHRRVLYFGRSQAQAFLRAEHYSVVK
ncbi:BPSL0067 family protein [Massilia sp. NR 4-1]|uniref:BPSL0067 family protein n=1 Tax=Massilia sp. NR 4-1 TaxID=1678028 RepID=UPI0009E2FC56|nr:BPSL0067 family protein [Massilia sp. NR 4-1]